MMVPSRAAGPHRFLFRLGGILPAFAAIVLLTTPGCEKGPEKKPLTMEPEYSINIVAVPDFWPREKYDWSEKPAIAEIQKETWAREGTPEYIRTVYTFDGRVVHPEEMAEDHVMAGQRPVPLTEWVYIDEEKVIRFDGPKVIEEDLPDPVRIVCLYGDPNTIRNFRKQDFVEEQWFYYNHGKVFTFVDRKLVNENDLGASAPGMTRMR